MLSWKVRNEMLPKYDRTIRGLIRFISLIISHTLVPFRWRVVSFGRGGTFSFRNAWLFHFVAIPQTCLSSC